MPKNLMMTSSNFSNLVLLLFVGQLPDFVLAQIQSSTFKLLSNSSGTLCAADGATTVYQARSLIECQMRCSKNKCYVGNFYTDAKTCEVYNFKPSKFTTSKKKCTSFRNSNIWPDYLDCLIEALGWGKDDVAIHNHYISINGVNVLDNSLVIVHGFHTMQLDPRTCTASNQRFFDTYASEANSDSMATYINSLPVFTVLMGITADEPWYRLTSNARNSLAGIGVNVESLNYRGKGAFVAVVGQPAMSVSVAAAAGGNNVKIKAISRVYMYPVDKNVVLIRQ